MRNGNKQRNKRLLVTRKVLILPMRNGNQIQRKVVERLSDGVLILPMRNGNCTHSHQSLHDMGSSYPTYEEWKQEVLFNVTDPELFVLILPMRNGNRSLSISRSCFIYCSYPTYEEWKTKRRACSTSRRLIINGG